MHALVMLWPYTSNIHVTHWSHFLFLMTKGKPRICIEKWVVGSISFINPEIWPIIFIHLCFRIYAKCWRYQIFIVKMHRFGLVSACLSIALLVICHHWIAEHHWFIFSTYRLISTINNFMNVSIFIIIINLPLHSIKSFIEWQIRIALVVNIINITSCLFWLLPMIIQTTHLSLGLILSFIFGK